MLLKKFKEVLLLSLSSVNVILVTLQTWLSRALSSSFSSVLARRTKCTRKPCTLLHVTFPNIHRFKDFFFTDRLSNKPFLIWLNTYPPHLKYVATLPYKSPLIAWHSNRLQPQPNMHRKYVSRATIIGLLLLHSREGWRIAMCLCLSVWLSRSHTSKITSKITPTFRLGTLLTTTQYVIYFRFCGWRHFSTVFNFTVFLFDTQFARAPCLAAIVLFCFFS